MNKSDMNKYEMIVIAAREARRLNAVAKLSGRDLKERATSIAWRRLQGDEIKFTYEPESFEAEEPQAAAPAPAPAPETP
jgi:DNA-directed RNA polymerase subunit K/omega